jgi:uncharacterized protein (TIGR02453 family)
MAEFRGFGPDALPFFKALAFHQSKAWFEENRALYEAQVRGPMQALFADLGPALAARGIPLTADPKRGLFRINRDVRFSKDKSPYKAHASGVVSRDGTKRAQGFVYVHVDPAGSFLAAGFWQPEPDRLKALRDEIAAAPARFAEMRARLRAAGLELEAEHAAARMPRGYEALKGTDAADGVRLKSFIASRTLDEAALRSPALVGDVSAFAADAMPLLSWGWTALGERD